MHDTASMAVVDPQGMTVVVDSIEGANPGEQNGKCWSPSLEGPSLDFFDGAHRQFRTRGPR